MKNFLQKILTAIDNFFLDKALNDVTITPMPESQPAVPVAQPVANPDLLLPWEFNVLGSENNRHNVRALCDLGGLTYEQKEILTACVKIESDFDTGAIHKNYAVTQDGVRYLSSTDWGIVQVNDYWHIGPGKDFASSQFVLENPQADIEWMVMIYKTTGTLSMWDSFLSGAYKEVLGTV